MAKGTYRLTAEQREPLQLNWAGQPIREGQGYGGKPENIPATWLQPKPQNWVITSSDVCEVFGNGAYTLTLAEAAKQLELLTGRTPDVVLSSSKTGWPFRTASAHRRHNAKLALI